MTIGNVTLPAPNGFKTIPRVKGAFVETLDGTTRRAIQAVKNTYVVEYNLLSTTDYDAIQAEFDLHNVSNFVYEELGIDTTVHIDLSDREFIPGAGNYVSHVVLTLTEK